MAAAANGAMHYVGLDVHAKRSSLCILDCNGKRVKRAKLSDGDTFTLGSTDVVFSRELE